MSAQMLGGAGLQIAQVTDQKALLRDDILEFVSQGRLL